MKKSFLSVLISLLLVISLIPAVFADGADIDGGIDVVVEDENEPPVIFTDSTQRSWFPNDQTVNTADEYGTDGTNLYGDNFYDLDVRGNYLFTGETVTYYVIVKDENGEEDIPVLGEEGAPRLVRDGDEAAGACSEFDPIGDGFWADDATLVQFGEDPEFDEDLVYDDATMNTYRCVLTVQSGWAGAQDVSVTVTDLQDNTVTSPWVDRLNFNPELSITLTGGPITFGTVEEGSVATSSTVFLNNVGDDGVVMDMYIASSDFFTDPLNPLAVCGAGNGIPFDAFSYYATKGSLDSGSNDGSEEGLGANCLADADEFTPLPSHSGDIEDMCRIINHGEDDDEGSFLVQGASMSLTFQLEVPDPCEGSFTDGSFFYVGRVV